MAREPRGACACLGSRQEVLDAVAGGVTNRRDLCRRLRRGVSMGTLQVAAVAPLPNNVYLRRIIVGWKTLGHSRRFGAKPSIARKNAWSAVGYRRPQCGRSASQ